LKGIILYGPPASGKDTITDSLALTDPRCEFFPRLKAGPGKTRTYRVASPEQLADLRAKGEIAWENARYGATYAVDTPELELRLRRGIPVLHLGQVEAIEAIRDAVPDASWLVVSLWCNRTVAEARLRARNPTDVEERLRVWDETEPLTDADLSVDTGAMQPQDAAARIIEALAGHHE
jgi:guanylate kinase